MSENTYSSDQSIYKTSSDSSDYSIHEKRLMNYLYHKRCILNKTLNNFLLIIRYKYKSIFHDSTRNLLKTSQTKDFQFFLRVSSLNSEMTSIAVLNESLFLLSKKSLDNFRQRNTRFWSQCRYLYTIFWSTYYISVKKCSNPVERRFRFEG